jgi:hypothetical protein
VSLDARTSTNANLLYHRLKHIGASFFVSLTLSCFLAMSSTLPSGPAEPTADPVTINNAEAGPSSMQTLIASELVNPVNASSDIKVFAPPTTAPLTPAGKPNGIIPYT